MLTLQILVNASHSARFHPGPRPSRGLHQPGPGDPVEQKGQRNKKNAEKNFGRGCGKEEENDTMNKTDHLNDVC